MTGLSAVLRRRGEVAGAALGRQCGVGSDRRFDRSFDFASSNRVDDAGPTPDGTSFDTTALRIDERALRRNGPPLHDQPPRCAWRNLYCPVGEAFFVPLQPYETFDDPGHGTSQLREVGPTEPPRLAFSAGILQIAPR